MNFKLILGILIAAVLTLSAAQAGATMNCTAPGDSWNMTTKNLKVAYGFPQNESFFAEGLNNYVGTIDMGYVKSGGGTNAQVTGNIYIENLEPSFDIDVAAISAPGGEIASDFNYQYDAEQAQVNTLPWLYKTGSTPGNGKFVDFTFTFNPPASGEFSNNVKVTLRAVNGNCVGDTINITITITGTSLRNTFIKTLPPGFTAEWNSTETDATTTDCGVNGDNVTIYDGNSMPVMIGYVDPDEVSYANPINLGTGIMQRDSDDDRVFANINWITNAPEITNHWLLVLQSRGIPGEPLKTSPWLCDSDTIVSLNDVVPGCSGYDAAPDYSTIKIGLSNYYFAIPTTNSGAGSFVNASLNTSDEFESSSVTTNTGVDFYALYFESTNSTNTITPSEGGTCWAEFDDAWGTLYNMTGWNGTHYSYTKTSGFDAEGIHNWNVTCNDTTGYFAGVTDVQDDINVSGTGSGSTVPEFSDFAWVLAAVFGAGSFVLMRRIRKGF
ncbi:MAG: hypothetical protein PHC66_03685 [Candidatus Nanoarchaeia archaeon]|nr:hypothetical protein [Candidatus Nanoarchaeia archaeon]MDD5238951.1 hypothetical protein [Candidatus Nanoarchaeia archaeon]